MKYIITIALLMQFSTYSLQVECPNNLQHKYINCKSTHDDLMYSDRLEIKVLEVINSEIKKFQISWLNEYDKVIVNEVYVTDTKTYKAKFPKSIMGKFEEVDVTAVCFVNGLLSKTELFNENKQIETTIFNNFSINEKNELKFGKLIRHGESFVSIDAICEIE